MTGEEFGHALLRTIQIKAQENDKRDIVLMNQLESVVKRTLGIPETNTSEPAQFFQQPVKGEFPQWRVKYEGGKEVARRPIYNFHELAELMKEDKMFSSVDSCTPVPSREG